MSDKLFISKKRIDKAFISFRGMKNACHSSFPVVYSPPTSPHITLTPTTALARAYAGAQIRIQPDSFFWAKELYIVYSGATSDAAGDFTNIRFRDVGTDKEIFRGWADIRCIGTPGQHHTIGIVPPKDMWQNVRPLFINYVFRPNTQINFDVQYNNTSEVNEFISIAFKGVNILRKSLTQGVS